MHLALISLVGPGTMQTRLHGAIKSQLNHISPKADLPEELQQEFSLLMSACRDADTASDNEAEYCARQIVNLNEKMHDARH